MKNAESDSGHGCRNFRKRADCRQIGGLQAGYNVLNGSMMWGVETDISLSNATMSDSLCPYNDSLECEVQVSPIASIRPRVGYVTGDWMIYATAGAVVARVNVDAYSAQGGHVDDAVVSDFGWTAGLGIEHMIGDLYPLLGINGP